MSNDSYNGWASYETWLTYTWLSDTETAWSYWLEQAEELNLYQLERELKYEHHEFQPEAGGTYTMNGITGLYNDLMSTALSKVDWLQIAKALKGM